MLAQIPASLGVLDQWNAKRVQMPGRTDPGALKDGWRRKRARAKQHFIIGTKGRRITLVSA